MQRSFFRSFCWWQYYILLMSYYSHFIHTIYLLKWFENNYTPRYGLSLMEKYIANFLKCKCNKGRNFFKMEGKRVTLCFELVKEGIINFKILVEESKR